MDYKNKKPYMKTALELKIKHRELMTEYKKAKQNEVDFFESQSNQTFNDNKVKKKVRGRPLEQIVPLSSSESE